MGLDLEYYWTITPKQLEKHVEVFKKTEENRAKAIDWQNFHLGKYVGIAVNDPKKYPQKPFLHDTRKKPMTPEEMEARVRRMTLILDGKVQK